MNAANDQKNKAETIDLEASPGFSAWLYDLSASLVFTSYRKGELIALGVDPTGKLSASTCGLERCMGLGVGNARLWVASAHQLWRFQNFVPPGAVHEGFDAVFVPLNAHTTGAVDVHDIAEDSDGNPIFATPRFNCLGRLSPDHSFEAVWKPPFIDTLIAEDRCHLNGLAMKDGKPGYVTCVATTNESGGWRQHRNNGGVVIDVQTGDTLCAGLSMPHSPRVWDGKLWLHQSGLGEFGFIDLNTGKFEAICKFPGFVRGLSFHDRYAVVGVSLPRANSGFEDLQISDQMAKNGVTPECAIYVIDMAAGKVVHQVKIGPNVDEIYDVAFLPGVRNPKFVRHQSDEIKYFIRPLEQGNSG